MTAINFLEANDCIGKPVDLTENQCYGLPVCRLVSLIPGETDHDTHAGEGELT